jgi:hypothetical protein
MEHLLGLVRHRSEIQHGPCLYAPGRAVGRTPASTLAASRPPVKLGVTLNVRTRAAWRAWLVRNHARKKEIWPA